MGLLDALRPSPLKDASLERLFALSTAHVTLEVDLALKPAGRRLSCSSRSRPVSSCAAENEMQELLDVAAPDSGARLSRKTD